MAKTKLQGFLKGANQITAFMKGETIKPKQFISARTKITNKLATMQKKNENPSKNSSYQAYLKKAHELDTRIEKRTKYVAFKNYINQMMDFYEKKDKGISRDTLHQLMANNRAVRDLDIHGGQYFKYGKESSDAIMKFKQIMMDNDYRKLQYLNKLPEEALDKIEPKHINDVRLPLDSYAGRKEYDNLKERMEQLSTRLEELDANRHVNSAEFKKMKAAVEAMKETLVKPWTELKQDDHYAIGEKLEDLQKASMDYVQAKGVGRQSSKLGKDRMELGLNLADVSSTYMNNFASKKRIEKVHDFEKSLDVNITKNNVCKDFLSESYDKYNIQADIFENKEHGIDEYGQPVNPNLEADNDDFEDNIYNEF